MLVTPQFYTSDTLSNQCSAQEVIVPILAQRLLINMRNVDDLGSRPLASTLMFAKTSGVSEEQMEDVGDYEGPMNDESPPAGRSEKQEEQCFDSGV